MFAQFGNIYRNTPLCTCEKNRYDDSDSFNNHFLILAFY